MFEKLKEKNFQILALHHAEAILEHDLGGASQEIESALDSVILPIEELVRGGGGEAGLTQRIRRQFAEEFGWRKHNFTIQRIVDGKEKESISHEIDHVKEFNGHTFALEIEWNNKDPFFDRDLENFKRLHADGVISIGTIITRGESLQDGIQDLVERFARKNNISTIEQLNEYYTTTPRQVREIEHKAKSTNSFARGWAAAFFSDKFASSTTHWKKLEDRVHRGVGNPCPLLLIGLPVDIVLE